MAGTAQKLFVLDTNVILHDSSCILQFKEHDVVLPITVLEELDKFKKGHEALNFHAREFVRMLDKLSGDHVFNGGVRIGEDSLATGKISVTALSYIRGRSLMETYFIVDEAQNLTPHEVKTIITRAGEGTKMVFTGDIFQIDHPYLDMHSNGLSYLIARMQGQPLYAHVMLEKGERSCLAELASDLL